MCIPTGVLTWNGPWLTDCLGGHATEAQIVLLLASPVTWGPFHDDERRMATRIAARGEVYYFYDRHHRMTRLG